MITFQQFLEEGVNDYFLYHGTGIVQMETIVPSDMIEARTHHITNRYHGKNSTDFKKKYMEPDKWNDPIYKGVSLSRNSHFAFAFAENNTAATGGVLLKFDKRKLATRFKIIPINYFAGSRHLGNQINMLNEHEEFLLGPLLNMSKYLDSIYVDNSLVQDQISSLYTEYKLPASRIEVKRFNDKF